MALNTNEINLEKYEEFFSLIRKYQKYVYIIIAIIFMFFFYFKLIKPNIYNISKKLETFKQYQAILEKKKATLAEKEKIEQELQRLQKVLRQKEDTYFSANSFKDFSLNIIPQISWKYNIKITSMTYYKEHSLRQGLYIYPINIKFESDYLGLVNFCNDLEKFDKLVQLADFQISRKSIDPLILLINLNFNSYIIKK